jgi:hypothetical protein
VGVLGLGIFSRPDVWGGLFWAISELSQLSVDTDTLPMAGGAFPRDTLLNKPGGAFPLVTLLLELGGACPEPEVERHSKIW